MQPFHFDNGKTITVHVDSKIYSFNKEDNQDLFYRVRELYKQGDYDAITKLIITPESINEKYGDSNLTITPEGRVYINEEELHTSLSKVILELYKEDAPIDCFINFWNKLSQNPSNRARLRLYDFVENKHVTLLPDGNLLLYRVVRKTEEEGVYVDIYTGTMKQSVGDTINMSRALVNDDDSVECSHGLVMWPPFR